MGVALCLSLMGGTAAPAQTLGGPSQIGVVQSAVLLVDFDRLFNQSAYGQRITRELKEAGAEIAAENRRIEAELTEEERSLTDLRATMDPVEFRKLAVAFDERVQTIRAERDAKAQALGARNDAALRDFQVAAEPVLRALMRESGAVVMMERRSVLLSDDDIDITDSAIEAIDAAIGDGASRQNPTAETGNE